MLDPTDLYDELSETCDQVWVFRQPEEQGGRDDALGALMETLDGGALAVTATISSDGLATVTARAFDANGEQINVGVIVLDKSVMITA